MLSKLLKLPFTLIIFIAGILLILVAFYIPSELTKLSFTPRTDISWPLLFIGISLVITSLILYLLSEGYLKLPRTHELPPISAKVNDTKLNILFGRIENYECAEDDTAIVLSGNEYFDDHVFHDRSTALGAYLYKYFGDDLAQLIQTVRESLQDYPFELIEKEKGVLEKSYGIGATIFLDRPLHSNKRIILTSTITRRVGEGVKSDMTYISNAVRNVLQILHQTQIHRIFLPVIGSGHGGITRKLALSILLSSVIQFLRQTQGHHIQELNILVFKKDDETPPEIPRKDVQRILDNALLLSE